MHGNIAFDAASLRRLDANGYLHVAASHLTKEQIAPYLGREIGGWQTLGLDPERVYQGLRPADELQKAAATFNGLPLQLEHHPDSAAAPQKLARVGSLGTSAVWNPPYIDNALTITDAAAIAAVESGRCRELSCAYLFDADFTPGVWQGRHYDFVMRNIRGNHVALVAQGRAGADVAVADAAPEPPATKPAAENGDASAPEDAAGPASAGGNACVGGASADQAETGSEAAGEPASPGGNASAGESAPEASPQALVKNLSEEFFRGMSPEARERVTALLRALSAAPADESRASVRISADKAEAASAPLSAAADARFPEHAREEARRHFRALYGAAALVRPLSGEVDPLSFDSAEDIYAHALAREGVEPARYPRQAWRGMVDMALSRRPGGFAAGAPHAPAAGSARDMFAGLARIRVE